LFVIYMYMYNMKAIDRKQTKNTKKTSE